MKKILAMLLVGALLLTGTAMTSTAGEGRGGPMGFFAGCCFGIRAGGDYNEGKELHWREWGMLIPFFNLYVAIINGIDGANGVTTAEFADMYGAEFY